MRYQPRLFESLLCASLLASVNLPLCAQNTASAAGRNMAQMTFATTPGFPTCALGSVQTGDPRTGPSIILGKMAAGCSIPWHWHTPNEHLMIVSGVARVEEKDGQTFILRAGAFALMPSRQVHRFRCTTACSLYVYSDTAFDLHYVDATGEELSPSDALKAEKETPARPAS